MGIFFVILGVIRIVQALVAKDITGGAKAANIIIGGLVFAAGIIAIRNPLETAVFIVLLVGVTVAYGVFFGITLVAAIAAVAVGLFLVFGASTPAIADGLFVGGIAVVLAVYLRPGVSSRQARVVAIVLLALAIYAFVRGFGLLELTIIRQLGGITAIVSGVVLALPFVRSMFEKK